MQRKSLNPRTLAVTAVMTAIVFVLTRMIQVPTPVVGYIHLGDVGVFFAAFAFGPWVGAAAGGLGTFLADLTSGPYAVWAPFSLLIHGAQGLVVGWLSTRWRGVGGMLVSAAIGGVIVVIGYLAAGTYLKGLGAALMEVPLNMVQVTVGTIVSIPLYAAVSRAYPPILRLGSRRD